MNRKLKFNPRFRPLAVVDESYPNGIFVFNITALLAFLDGSPDDFPIVSVAVADIPHFGAPKDEQSIEDADLTRPILFAEIAPGRYNLIDGHHRVAKARRKQMLELPARRVACPTHVEFLTSVDAYRAYVNYWNDKFLKNY